MPERIVFTSLTPAIVAEPGEVPEGEEPEAPKRTISGIAVPWSKVARVSGGRLVKFLPGSVSLIGEAVIRDHDRTRPIGIVASESTSDEGLSIVSKVSATHQGDEALTLAADGVLKHWSVGVEPLEFSFEDADGEQVLVVSKGEADEVSLLVKGAFGSDAAVTKVAASQPESEATVPEPIVEAAPTVIPPTAVRVTSEAFPYSFAGHGPSMVRDVVLAGDGDTEAKARLLRAQHMLADEKAVHAGMIRMAAAPRSFFVQAAPELTTTVAEIVPVGYRPDLYVDLIDYEAPLWSAATKYPISDFTPFTIPRATTRTGLSGVPADEITPTVPGDLDVDNVTVTPVAISGSYQFSRNLALASNPAIDMIATRAMNEEWLLDVETRFTTAVLAATTDTPIGVYADAAAYVLALRTSLATFRVQRKARADIIITADAEYGLAASADDTTKRPLLPYGPAVNSFGEASTGFEQLSLYGIPIVPHQVGLAAGNTLLIKRDDLVAFSTPVWNFRFDAVPGAGSTMNPLVLQLSKYSGVAFWIRRASGVRQLTKA